MDALDTGHFVYLAILGIAVVGWFIAENRASLGQTVRTALAWAFIFLGVVAGYGLWGDIRDDVAPRQTVFTEDARVEVPRAFDGHYYLTLQVNGTPVDFVVDTGATDMVLSREDAAAHRARPRRPRLHRHRQHRERTGADCPRPARRGVARRDHRTGASRPPSTRAR